MTYIYFLGHIPLAVSIILKTIASKLAKYFEIHSPFSSKDVPSVVPSEFYFIFTSMHVTTIFKDFSTLKS